MAVTYEYQCEACEIVFEQEVPRVTKKKLKKCPNCGEFKLERLISPFIFYDATPRTVGTQAERNTKHMGQLTLEKKRNEIAERRERGREEFAKNLPENMRVVKPPKESPTGLTKEKADKINKASPQQLKKYIFEGKGL